MITKVFIDPRTKRPTLIGRVFSGTLRKDDVMFLVNRRQKQRIKRLGVMEITDILDVDEVPAGNLFAIYGFITPAGETFVREEDQGKLVIILLWLIWPVGLILWLADEKMKKNTFL